jgi:hypothetical protein
LHIGYVKLACFIIGDIAGVVSLSTKVAGTDNGIGSTAATGAFL